MHVVIYVHSQEDKDSQSELLALCVMAECISLNCHLFEPEFEPVGGMMATHVKLKRDKVGAQDYDAQVKGKGTVFVTYFSAPLIQSCALVSFPRVVYCVPLLHRLKERVVTSNDPASINIL